MTNIKWIRIVIAVLLIVLIGGLAYAMDSNMVRKIPATQPTETTVHNTEPVTEESTLPDVPSETTLATTEPEETTEETEPEETTEETKPKGTGSSNTVYIPSGPDTPPSTESTDPPATEPTTPPSTESTTPPATQPTDPPSAGSGDEIEGDVGVEDSIFG